MNQKLQDLLDQYNQFLDSAKKLEKIKFEISEELQNNLEFLLEEILPNSEWKFENYIEHSSQAIIKSKLNHKLLKFITKQQSLRDTKCEVWMYPNSECRISFNKTEYLFEYMDKYKFRVKISNKMKERFQEEIKNMTKFLEKFEDE